MESWDDLPFPESFEDTGFPSLQNASSFYLLALQTPVAALKCGPNVLYLGNLPGAPLLLNLHLQATHPVHHASLHSHKTLKCSVACPALFILPTVHACLLFKLCFWSTRRHG